MVKVSEMPADAAIGGAELVMLSDAGTSKQVTVDVLVAYVVDEIEGLDVLAAPAAGDSFMMLEGGTKLESSTYATIENAIANTMYAEAEMASAIVDADVFLIKNGGTKETCLASRIATYCLAQNTATIRDISGTAANSTPANADMFLTVVGTIAKKTTWLEVKNGVLGGLGTYMNALSAVTLPALTDVLYCTQTGTAKKITVQQILNVINYPINGSGAAGYLADWSDSDTLQNTYAVVTTFAASSNTEIATGKAVRDEMSTIINDATAMAAAIVDADTILIDDGAGGTQRKATFTQIIAWIATASLTFNGMTITDATNIVLNTTTGTKIGTAVGQKLGFWNVTPVIQPLGADQADQGAMTGTVLGDLGATSGGWGYSSEANADAVHTKFDLLIADVAALDTLLTAIRTALVAVGIMKGSA